MKHFLPLLLLTVILFGCNGKSIERDVNRVMKNTRNALHAEYAMAKKKFNARYEQVQLSVTANQKQQLTAFHTSVLSTVDYADSLKKEMEQYDFTDMDTDVVSHMFINLGAGDTLLERMKQSYRLANEVALTEKSKTAVKNSGINVLDHSQNISWTDNYFRSNMPMGAAMLLHGFQTELLKVSMEVLEEY